MGAPLVHRTTSLPGSRIWFSMTPSGLGRLAYPGIFFVMKWERYNYTSMRNGPWPAKGVRWTLGSWKDFECGGFGSHQILNVAGVAWMALPQKDFRFLHIYQIFNRMNHCHCNLLWFDEITWIRWRSQIFTCDVHIHLIKLDGSHGS